MTCGAERIRATKNATGWYGMCPGAGERIGAWVSFHRFAIATSCCVQLPGMKDYHRFSEIIHIYPWHSMTFHRYLITQLPWLSRQLSRLANMYCNPSCCAQVAEASPAGAAGLMLVPCIVTSIVNFWSFLVSLSCHFEAQSRCRWSPATMMAGMSFCAWKERICQARQGHGLRTCVEFVKLKLMWRIGWHGESCMGIGVAVVDGRMGCKLHSWRCTTCRPSIKWPSSPPVVSSHLLSMVCKGCLFPSLSISFIK